MKSMDNNSNPAKVYPEGTIATPVEEGEDNPADSNKQVLTESKKKAKKDEEIFIHEDDAFFERWAGPILLGPFLPAIFAIIVIVSGQLVMNTYEGTCGYDLPSFIGAAIAVCYLFLIVYSWVFLGDVIRFESKTLGIDIIVLAPFRSFRWIVILYFAVAVASFIVWIVGTVLLEFAVFCQDTSPGLYSYTVFLVASYWMGFGITGIYIIKLFFGSNIAALIKESTRASTVEEVEEKIFNSKFQDYDKDKEGKIKVDDLASLLESLGVFVPEEEVETLQSTLDPEETGFIGFHELKAWFKSLNAELDARGDGEGSEADEDEADVQAASSNRFSSKKQT